MIKAIGYIRVSTEDQAKEGISLEVQRKKIGAYCQLNEMFLVGFMADEGISAKSIDGRPGLKQLLEMVERKEIDAIVIYKLDRMFRNTVDALQTAQALDQRGIALHSITERLDTKSAIGKFFFSLMASLAEMERNLISERTKDALRHKKENGERVGTIAYGKRLDENDPSKLVDDPHEQQILAIITELRCRNYSYRKIAADLNASGFLTRRGTPWKAVTVRNQFAKLG